MHMADALVSPAIGLAFFAASAGVAGYSIRAIKNEEREKISLDRNVSLMGVLGAFVFAVQMLNFAIPGTGASGHLGGGLLLAVLLGAPRAFLVMGSVLIVQALFFADGGLLAFGCNWFNLAVFPCFIAYPLIWKPLAKREYYAAATVLAALAGLLLGSGSVALQTTASGIAELPLAPFLTAMLSIHFFIGLAEGAATCAIVLFLRRARPELVSSEKGGLPLLVGVAFASLLVAGFALLYASSAPDGLEWAIERVWK